MLGNVGPSQAPRGIIPTGTPAIGDVIYASSTSAWARLASSDSGKILTAGGAATAPSWSWPNPANMQIASQAIGDLLYASSTTAWSRLGISDDGKVLHSAGAGQPPAWEWVNPADMRIASQAIGDLLYASSSTAWSRLADVAAGSILVSGGVGTAPAWDNDPTLIVDAIGTAQTPAITLKNTTAAGSGAQQYSPMVVLSAQGYNLGTSATNTVEHAIQEQPEEKAASAPVASLKILSRIGGTGAWTERAAIGGADNASTAIFNGALRSTVGFAIASSFSASAYLSFGRASGYAYMWNFTAGDRLDIISSLAAGTNDDAIRLQAYSAKSAGYLASIGSAAGTYSRKWGVRWDDAVVHTPEARTSGVPQMHVATGAAHTGLTAGTEINEYYYNLNRTLTWAAGAIPSQRFIRIDSPTIAFASASTVTTAATFYIDKAPVQGANATLTATHPIWIDDGEIRLDSAVALGDSTDPTLGHLPTGFAAAQNEWLCIWTQNGRRMIPCWAPS